MGAKVVTRPLTDEESKAIVESLHNLVYDKKVKYKKKGAPENLQQFEEYKKDLEEIEMLENLKTMAELGCISITPPEGQGSLTVDKANVSYETESGNSAEVDESRD